MNIGLLTRFFAVGPLSDSGIGQHFRVLADALAAQGHRVHVLHVTNEAGAAEALSEGGASWTAEVVSRPVPKVIAIFVRNRWPLQTLAESIWLSRAAARAAVRAASEQGFAVLETHSYQGLACHLLGRTRRPRVVTRVSTTARQVHTFNGVKSRVLEWHSALERSVIRRSDVLVTHTRHHRDLVAAAEDVPADRFYIVPHGLPDPGAPAPTATGGTELEFLFVGRFEPRKGIDVLLDAIPVIAREFPHVRFTLAGSHGDGNAWSAFASAHPALVASRVKAPGAISRPQLESLYRRCSILVAPSRYESFGLIYPEAMAHGKPVIGTRAGGIPEVVIDGSTGLLADPGDRATLIDAMRQLCADENLRRKLGAAARLDFEHRFSAAKMAEASAALYERSLVAS